MLQAVLKKWDLRDLMDFLNVVSRVSDVLGE